VVHKAAGAVDENMIGNVILLIVVWSVSVFMANRLYVIIKYGAINIKGAVYSKVDTPIMYWVQMAIIVVGLVLVGGVGIVTTLGSTGFIK
jgi:hypothetical protein